MGAGPFVVPGCSPTMPIAYAIGNGYSDGADSGLHPASRSDHKGNHMLEVQLIDPNGYDVPFARRTISPDTDAQQAKQALLTVEAPRHAATSGVGYSPRQYTVKTRPAPCFSVVVVRPGLPTVALGSYRSPEFAGLTAWNLTAHLGEADAFVTVEPHDEDLPHLPILPTDPQQLAEHLDEQAGLDVHARLAAQVGTKAAGLLLADAYMVRATALRTAA